MPTNPTPSIADDLKSILDRVRPAKEARDQAQERYQALRGLHDPSQIRRKLDELNAANRAARDGNTDPYAQFDASAQEDDERAKLEMAIAARSGRLEQLEQVHRHQQPYLNRRVESAAGLALREVCQGRFVALTETIHSALEQAQAIRDLESQVGSAAGAHLDIHGLSAILSQLVLSGWNADCLATPDAYSRMDDPAIFRQRHEERKQRGVLGKITGKRA
jgi:hypothetical protein